MITSDTMIKELTILRPADFPYRLMSLEEFFYNDHHAINFYHAAGMHLIYQQRKICYVFGGNEYYQLLKLQNTEELHLPEYNWLLLRGIYGTAPEVGVKLNIEQPVTAGTSQQQDLFNSRQVYFMHWMPEPGDEIALVNERNPAWFHHFRCDSITENVADPLRIVNVSYLNTYGNVYTIINTWFDEENKLAPFQGQTDFKR